MNYAEDRLDRRSRQGTLQDDYRVALEIRNHKLLGNTLRDNGWNAHAMFHYGIHWMQHPNDIKASMDYCQMLELSGYAWNALLAVLAFRNGSPLMAAPEEEELAVPPPDLGEWLVQSHEAMKGRHCGCGMSECGKSDCFDCIQDHSEVVSALNVYFTTFRSRYNKSNNVPTANEVHRQISLNPGKAIEIRVEPSLHPLLQFWTHHADYRTGSHVWQMFAVKLFFLTVPSLAIEAAVCTTNLEAVAPAYKSHRAFYVFIRALSLGERIKPNRIARLPHWHIPLWDRLWHQTDSPVYCPQSPIKKKTSASVWQQAAAGCVSTFPSHIPNALHVVGDSHVLSLAWQTGILEDGTPVVFVPVLITGLKAWHTRPQTQFFTHTCLLHALDRIPADTVLLSAGEIDCREGMGGPLLEGYTEDCLRHVQATVQEYTQSISRLNKTMLMVPVAPHLQRPAKGRAMGQASRRQTMRVWNEQLRDHDAYLDYVDELCDEEYRLNRMFNADGTHLNSAFLPLVLQAISRNQVWRRNHHT